jgi:hypothetical protein
MPGNLKKRYTLDPAVITHLFDGEPKVGSNDFGGYHSEAVHRIDDVYAKIDGQPDPAMLQRRLDGKPYQFYIKLRKGGDWTSRGLCSFFPAPWVAGGGNKWDKETLVRMIEQALTDPADSVRHSRAAWQTTQRGIRTTGIAGAQELVKIKVAGVSCHVKYQNGEVESVYPATFG